MTSVDNARGAETSHMTQSELESPGTKHRDRQREKKRHKGEESSFKRCICQFINQGVNESPCATVT